MGPCKSIETRGWSYGAFDYLGPQRGELVVREITYSYIIPFMRDKRSLNNIEVLNMGPLITGQSDFQVSL